MKTSEMLNAIASWLEDSNNEALLLAEHNDKCLSLVAEACISAASILKKAGEDTDEIEENPYLEGFPPDRDKCKICGFDHLTDVIDHGAEMQKAHKDNQTLQSLRELVPESDKEKGGLIPIKPEEPYISTLDPKSIEELKGMNLDAEELIELQTLADSFDASEDENLKKYAAVIDEILLTIATPPNAFSEKLAANERKIDQIVELYQNPRKSIEKQNKTADYESEIAKAPVSKQTRILEEPLSTRYCPDHPGAQLARKGDHLYQCALDNKLYDYKSGYTLEDGTKVPGGDVSEQTKGLNEESHAIFDTRENRLQSNKV